jgi:hypothetical protein
MLAQRFQLSGWGIPLSRATFEDWPAPETLLRPVQMTMALASPKPAGRATCIGGYPISDIMTTRPERVASTARIHFPATLPPRLWAPGPRGPGGDRGQKARSGRPRVGCG